MHAHPVATNTKMNDAITTATLLSSYPLPTPHAMPILVAYILQNPLLQSIVKYGWNIILSISHGSLNLANDNTKNKKQSQKKEHLNCMA